MSELQHAGRVVDPIAVGLVAAGVCALSGWNGPLTRDLGVFVYGGERVLDGVPPYAGVFNSVGPLADLAPALGIWLGRLVGLGPVHGARLLFLVLTAVCCALVCLLGRQTLGGRAGGLIAAAAMLSFRLFVVLGGSGPREKTTMVLFLVAALVLLGRRRWLAAGACTALATLAWQPVLAVAAATAAVSVANAGAGRLRAAAAFVLGGAIPSAAAVGYFLAEGRLGLAIDGFVLINLQDTRQPSALTDPATTWHVVWTGYGWSTLVVAGGLLALLGLAAVRLVGRRANDPVVALAAGAVAALAWTTYAVNGAPDLFVLLPFAAVGVAGAVLAVARHAGPRIRPLLVAATVTVAVTVAAGQALAARSDVLLAQQADVRRVVTAVPDATLASFDAPNALVLAGRTNPSRYQLFISSQERYVDAHYPGGLAGYAAWVDRVRPTVLVARRGGLPEWTLPGLRPHYAWAGRARGWTWYVARSAGPATLAAVRAALPP